MHFNPRPPRGGRPENAVIGSLLIDISIHAPREGGDAGQPRYFHLLCVISIHAPREGGDGRKPSASSENPNFNPRPPRGGRQWFGLPSLPRIHISIHAPREGGDITGNNFDIGAYISIHAPREGGDNHGFKVCDLATEFQSTPPARGATVRYYENKGYNAFISIHAPREGGDAGASIFCSRTAISIHAPREGGDQKFHRPHPNQVHFNPRPPRGGRPRQSSKSWLQAKISIHAPREGGD